MKDLSKKVFYKLFCFHILLSLSLLIPLLSANYFLNDYSIDTTHLFFLCGFFGFLMIAGGFFLAINYASLHKTLKPVVHMAEVGDTAGKVAHDLRGPMTGIESVLQGLETLESPDPVTQKYLRLLHLSADRLRRVSDDLLLKQQGKEEVAQTFDLHEVLDRLVGEYEAQSALTNVSFRKEYADGAVTVCGQRNKITRMFGNLIKNALEAMHLEGSLNVRTAVTGESVRVTIGDSGPGMSSETVAKILSGESFSAGKNDGHGIGLSVVREVLKCHRGEWEIKSELGKGADFILTLPRQVVIPASENVSLVSKHVIPAKAGIQKEMKLLDPDFRRDDKRDRRDEGFRQSDNGSQSDRNYNVLVIDDELAIRMSWELKQQMLKIGDLHCYANLEELQSNGIDLATIDIAFIDKNIAGSAHSAVEVIEFLRENRIPKIVLASGENTQALEQDPQFATADYILSEKIPDTLQGLV